MLYWNNFIKFFYIHCFIAMITLPLIAQENSPYSRYGIGNLRASENIANKGMGGVCIADNNIQIVNPQNPATYTGLKLTSYQFGLSGNNVTIKSATASNRVGITTLNYINIGMAVSKKMGLAFGLIPTSSARYNMQTSEYNTSVQTTVTNSYYGGGGLQKVFLGAAYRIKDFSIGFNGGYHFGNMSYSSESTFADSLYMLSNNIYGRKIMGGFFWQLGIHQNLHLDSNNTIKIGANIDAPHVLKAKKEMFWESYLRDIENVVSRVDSVSALKGDVKMPMTAAVGVMLQHNDIWNVGMDFNYGNWQKYSSYGSKDSMANSWTVRIGGSISPDPSSVNSYWKRMTFRAGFYTGKDAISFNGNHIGKTAGTVGFGYPIRRTNNTIGMFNFSLEIGGRGNVNNGMIKENFTRFGFGITFNDKWFLKRRYD